MRWRVFCGLTLFWSFLFGCDVQMPAPQPSLSLWEESGDSLEAVPAAARLRLGGLRQVPVEDIWLVRGDVSSVSQGKLRRGEVPQTVLTNREPLAAWTEGADIVLAPSEILVAGQGYSLVALGVGLLGAFWVSEEERPLLWLWGLPSAKPGEDLTYCVGEPPLLKIDGGFEHLLSEVTVQREAERGVAPGAASDLCVRISVPDDVRDFYVPPQQVGDWLLDPQPVQLSREDLPSSGGASPPDACQEPDQVAFEGGCASVHGAALTLSVSRGSYHFELFAAGREDSQQQLLLIADEAQTHTFGPLEPNQEYLLRAVRFSGATVDSGAPALEEIQLRSGAAAPHFVLTEVLADPLGPEPQAEWVEVVNLGNGPGSLKGLLLWDSSGASHLPDVTLEPSEYGLIVRHDFALGPDAVPNEAAVPVFVDSLGANGLRNSGEEVHLETEDGRRLSSIPAIAAGAGQSVARVDPWLPDIEESFVKTKEPSPGAPSVASIETEGTK